MLALDPLSLNLCSLAENFEESLQNTAANKEMDSDDENTQGAMMVSNNDNEQEQETENRAITRSKRATKGNRYASVMNWFLVGQLKGTNLTIIGPCTLLQTAVCILMCLKYLNPMTKVMNWDSFLVLVWWNQKIQASVYCYKVGVQTKTFKMKRDLKNDGFLISCLNTIVNSFITYSCKAVLI